MAIAPTKLAQTSAAAASISAFKDPQLYAAALIQQNGGAKKPDYGKIVAQLDALQRDPDPAVREFGQALEREVVHQLSGEKIVQMTQVEKALNSATYTAGGQSFSRNGDTIDETRAMAAKAPNKNNPSFVKYMEYDRAHGDGKWATNDSAKINEAWRNMIVAGARTPGEYAQRIGALNDNWGTTSAQYNALFSSSNLSAMADKAVAGLNDGYNFAASALSNDGSPASLALRTVIGGGNATQGAYKLGLAKGIGGAAGDLLLTLGKVVRFAIDANPVTGIAGDIARDVIPDNVKNWANSNGIGQAFAESTPSFARALKSIEGAADVTKNVAHYFATHSKLEIQAGIAVALVKKWDSLSGEYEAMNGNPVKQAEWLGEKTGAILFEVASSFIPVAGVAGKVAKGGDIAIDTARGIEKLDDMADAGRAAGKVDEIGRISQIVDDVRIKGNFDDLVRTAALSRDELTLLARADKFSADEISSVVSQLGLKTPRDQLILWSGLGKNGEVRAAAFAKESGGMTLEMTKGGSWLDELKLFEGGVKTVDELGALQIWEKASAEIAEQASGQVRVARGQISPTSVYMRIERPILLSNPKVLGIDEVPLKSAFGVK